LTIVLILLNNILPSEITTLSQSYRDYEFFKFNLTQKHFKVTDNTKIAFYETKEERVT